MTSTPTARSRLNPWPVCIIAFFTVAIVGCAVFIVFCSRHPADLVAADYYEQEVKYQGQMDRIQRAQARAEQASVKYDSDEERIVIALPPNHSVANASGEIHLYRPSATDRDQRLRLEPDARGQQTIDARNLLRGLWRVRVSWTVEKQDYFVDQEIKVFSPTGKS